MNYGTLQHDGSDRHHRWRILAQRAPARLAEERGFTFIELLVTMVVIGLLAAIALAQFLGQRERAYDTEAKSAATVVSRLMQICHGERAEDGDFRECDNAAVLSDAGVSLGTQPVIHTSASDCDADPASASVDADTEVRILQTGKDCFVLVALSDSQNRFWIIRRPNVKIERGCLQPGTGGCPADRPWAG